MALGPNDLKNISLPSAWDNTEMSRFALRDGTGYEELIRDINMAINALNAEFRVGYLANLFSITEDLGIEYRTGSSAGFEDHTEYSQPDAQRADVTGHMLPLFKKDRKMGWTNDWLEEARRAHVDADIRAMITDARDALEKALITRLFKMEEETGVRIGLGSGGVSVPFADGGAGTIAYTPPAYPNRGGTFLSTHDHYGRLDGITQANLETQVKHLWEHGIDGPYELLVSLADLASWTNVTNVTGYIEKADPLVMYGNSESLARVGAEYIGGVKTEYGFARLMPLGRIPTTYWGVTKTYGALDQRNPLKVRFDEKYGFGLKLVSENISLYPLTGAVGVLKFGVGVADRVAAVLTENDTSGDYATPTIS